MDKSLKVTAGVSLLHRILLGLAWALLVAIVLMAMTVRNLLPEAPDKWTYDWRTYFLSNRADGQRTDIALVLINEDTLAEYPYNVVDRGLVAAIIRSVGHSDAAAIGLDFAFERPTEPEKDRALVDAIRTSPVPIVLAAIDERARVATSRSLKYQESFFGDVDVSETGRVRAGHAFFSRLPDRLTTGDQVVRFISAPLKSTPSRESFARVLAELDGTKPKPSSPYIDWLLPPLNGEEIFAIVRVPEHNPVAGSESDSATVVPSYLKTLLKNKIVLIGAEFVDRDRHLTPLSVADRQAVPGVTIHAQILAQLRDGRSIGELSVWQELLAVFALALIGYVLGWRARLHQYGTATHFVSIVGLAVAGAVLFARMHLIIPTTLLFFGWLAGVIGGHYSGPVLRRFAGFRGAKDA